jgi:hypothetical protein
MAGKLAARQKIVDVAMSLIGSHYLWGSTGATPYVAAGSPYWLKKKDASGNATQELVSIPVSVARPCLDPRSPCVKAAYCEADTPHVCAGRFRKVGGSVINDIDDVVLASFLSNCEVVGRDVMFVESGPTSTWQSLFAPRLTPRVIIGKNITDLDGKTVLSGRAVWGEDCSPKRHFDCIGFISYVLNQATQKYFDPKMPWGGGIGDYFKITDEVGLGDAAVPGDIVFRGELDTDHPENSKWHHIAFITANGKVVQAEMAVTGVHADNTYDGAASWTARRRLQDALLPA